jgi:hypothetical protein
MRPLILPPLALATVDAWLGIGCAEKLDGTQSRMRLVDLRRRALAVLAERARQRYDRGIPKSHRSDLLIAARYGNNLKRMHTS